MKKIRLQRLNEKEKQNALNEVRLLASLDHQFIIGYKEAFYCEDQKQLCIIMEYATGGDLAGLIQQKQRQDLRFTEQEVWKALIEITQGLKELHDKQILHRDIKCANIFINSDVYKLGDLNVSKIAQRGLLYTQTGTPYYASPEIWRDEPYDNKSDIWSLGCVLYEMCAFHPPFLANDMEGLYKKIQKGSYPQLSGYSSNLQTIISHMLRLNSSSRPSCDQILNSHLMSVEFARMYLKTAQIQVSRKMMKTIQLPRNLCGLNDILPQKQYDHENKENVNRESMRYHISRLAPIRKTIIQKSEASQINQSLDCEMIEKKRIYRIASVHDGALPTLPSEGKRVVTRRRPSSQYKSIEEELLEKKIEAIAQRKKLQKQLSEQHPLPKPVLRKQMSNLPYLYKQPNDVLDLEKQLNRIQQQSPFSAIRKSHRKQITQIQ